MAYQPYGWEKIRRGTLNIGPGPHYRVYDVDSGATAATFRWSDEAKADAAKRNIEAGACERCAGYGWVIVDYARTPDGETPIGAKCESCRGTGR